LLFHGIEVTRRKAMLPTPPQKGAAFFFPKMTQSALCHPALIFCITRFCLKFAHGKVVFRIGFGIALLRVLHVGAGSNLASVRSIDGSYDA
ncbi:hypothetical protein BAE44_0006987, partial [Dichanthelium oligosanthes]